MSWMGQSAATHIVSTASANHSFWRDVTIGEPSRTTFGPITFTAYTANATIATTSIHTSGWMWNCHGSGFIALVGKDVEREQHDHVHGDGQDEPGEEHHAEQLV